MSHKATNFRIVKISSFYYFVVIRYKPARIKNPPPITKNVICSSIRIVAKITVINGSAKRNELVAEALDCFIT